METKTIVVAFIALGIGLTAGYVMWGTAEQQDASSMSHTMDSMTNSLEGKTGDAFDHAFIDEMIVHHEGAVAMAEQALVSAQHDEIKQMAQAIISAQTSEIETMRRWLREWYGE